jgi:hypothetical protein
VFELDADGRAELVEIPALRATLKRIIWSDMLRRTLTRFFRFCSSLHSLRLMLLYSAFDIARIRSAIILQQLPLLLRHSCRRPNLSTKCREHFSPAHIFLHFHLVPFLSASDQSPTPHPHLNEHRQNRCPCKTQNSFSEFHTLNDSRPRCRSAHAATQSYACKVSSSDSIVYDLLFETEHLPGNNC